MPFYHINYTSHPKPLYTKALRTNTIFKQRSIQSRLKYLQRLPHELIFVKFS